MNVHLANASTVVLCYMSCMRIYNMFLNVRVVIVFMSAKSSTELMFVMLPCQTRLKIKYSILFYSILFYWWKKSLDPEKTNDLSQVTDKPKTYCCTPRPDRELNSQHQW